MSTENKQKASELIKEFNSALTSIIAIYNIIKKFNELNSEDKRWFLLLFFEPTKDKIVISNKMIFLYFLMKRGIYNKK